ncbi:ABC transporter permease [Dactylosporangium matsuzakiense]|uniref:Transport permease protein n=1 Tax=Dactylosporangium matsuzakiense TaxID=53360 RepID=A0A9W6KNY1_9ACTN|nr:ABC transporter permease [Dactylosporangium matsuzakiense]UWZ43666.1 ABC transporter permease [Dactylosporangium matsuzakiense]GLL04567.1 transport permease protein [Dactylosporangium matsuzakiense]
MGTLAALEYHLVSYRRTWRSSVFSSFALPGLFLVAMGVTVGGYVDARPSGLGAPYLDWIGPGLLASTALQVAVGDSTWPVFSMFNWVRTYHAMRSTPLSSAAILRGHLVFLSLRVALSTLAFLLVLLPFGALHSWWAPATFGPAVLTGLAFAAPTFAFASVVPSDGYFAVLFRLLVVPMSLFAGVFFPVEGLPAAARALAYASPLWHGVELCRAATLGTATAWGAWTHVAVLVAYIAVGYVLAVRGFTRRLED